MMKKLICLFVSMTFMMACGSRSAQTNETAFIEGNDADRVEILYFHGAQRCLTCRAIESHTMALLDSLYTEETTNGKIVWKVVDISKPEYEAIADKYEVTGSSLFINGWKADKECVNNMTTFSFANARKNPEQFKEGIRSKIEELLKAL